MTHYAEVSSPLIQTASWWNNHFQAGLTFEGKEDEQWLWSGTDKEWTVLDWIENGLEGDDLHEAKLKLYGHL